MKRVDLKTRDDTDRRIREREAKIGDALVSRSSGSVPQHLIVPIDHSLTDDALFIVMPLASRSLSDAIAGGIDTSEQFRMIRHVGRGLMELAERSILHRDLKPANVLEHAGSWKLADFGMSRLLEDDTESLSYRGMGTHPYMAPEIWRNESATVKTDLYAYGVLMFEILSGRRPFAGPDFRTQHLTINPDLPSGAPDAIARLTVRLLAKDPARRPQDARAVLELLDVQERSLDFDQAQLLRAAVDAASRDSRDSALRESKRAAAKAQSDLREQGMADLEEILNWSFEHICEALPDSTMSGEGRDWKISHGRASVTFTIDTPEKHRGIQNRKSALWPILFGSVSFITEVPISSDMGILGTAKAPYVAANLLFEKRRSGGYAWSVISFTRRSSPYTYRLGPNDRPHGLDSSDFDKRRHHLWRRSRKVEQGSRYDSDSRFEKVPLSADVVSSLLRICLDIGGVSRHPTQIVPAVVWAVLAIVLAVALFLSRNYVPVWQSVALSIIPVIVGLVAIFLVIRKHPRSKFLIP